MRTPEEIKNEIAKLEKLKSVLPEYNFFGDNNHTIIDAQIDILNEEILDEDEIYDREEDFGDMGISTVLEAFQWMEGELDTLVDDNDLIHSK